MKEQELSENQRELARSKSALRAQRGLRRKRIDLANALDCSARTEQFARFTRLRSEPRFSAEIEDANSLATWHSIYDPMLTHFKLSRSNAKRFYELRYFQWCEPGSEGGTTRNVRGRRTSGLRELRRHRT